MVCKVVGGLLNNCEDPAMRLGKYRTGHRDRVAFEQMLRRVVMNAVGR
jgi:hypothetical protein